MPPLLIVGGGLFGSPAAALARRRGIEAMVFDASLTGAASPAAAGLFKEAWAGKKLLTHYRRALPVLDQLYGLSHVTLTCEDGSAEKLLFVPPRVILEPNPIRQHVTAIGDGWLAAGGVRHEGWVYVAAGIWCAEFLAGLELHGRAGASFTFRGESESQMHTIARGHQAIAFVRDPGTTFFSDGTAEREYTAEHDRLTLARAATMGLTGEPLARLWGYRPYTPGGPVFRRLGERTWLATGGRKMGTILGAAFARQLIEEELQH